ncbi:MAG: phage Gp37/Gp68 family protein [Desulfobacteraceae bacterium]|jgi:protein gp37|nr:MAG: phage Gp37/Gp68 family protein [Desulfobacteraceae bacterium]
MADDSCCKLIESSWNPVTGCTKISPACKNCYAERFALRLQNIGSPAYKNGFQVTLHPERLNLPLKWKKPRIVFVNSMGDLFHEEVPVPFIKQVFETMKTASRHTFQLLTKRAERLAEISPYFCWPDNIWIGVTVENQNYTWRINHLNLVPAMVKFICMEPLLGPVANLPLEGIDWVIVGGESGPKARVMLIDWVRQIRDQCLKRNVPFYFKQWGGIYRAEKGRFLDGRTWDGMPLCLEPVQSESGNLTNDDPAIDNNP